MMITLARSGDRPLEFSGEEIAATDSRQQQGPCQTRWYELALYRTDGGKHVVAINYRTQWQGELARDEAHVCESLAEAVEVLRSTIPELPMHAFPPGARFDEKRAHTEGAVRACYESAISVLLENVEPERI
jgi:hypothetical protein